MTDRESDIAGFLAAAGWNDARRSRVAGDASNRSYHRLEQASGDTAILMDAPPERGEDVRPFVRIADHLRAHGLSTPSIFHQDSEKGLLLIEDFGDALFARLIADNPGRQDALYALACDALLTLRNVPQINLARCDANWLVEMLEPAFSWYAISQDPAARDRFLAAFRPMAETTARAEMILSLRDFHVENLLLLSDREGVRQAGLLDFQDAFLAHPAYDLVSILQDARRDVPPRIEEAMLTRYLQRTGTSADAFGAAYALLGLQRNLRILGVFARLCQRDGKPQYLDMIPRVWGYVQRNLRHSSLQPLSSLLAAAVPEPTTDHLNKIRQACPANPSQP